ncbi:hypothetical protein ABIB25_005138 [Nakamurella sp. UYEF19]
MLILLGGGAAIPSIVSIRQERCGPFRHFDPSDHFQPCGGIHISRRT